MLGRYLFRCSLIPFIGLVDSCAADDNGLVEASEARTGSIEFSGFCIENRGRIAGPQAEVIADRHPCAIGRLKSQPDTRVFLFGVQHEESSL